MMKRWLLLIVAIIAPFIIVLAACEHQAEVRLEAFLALERMHRSSIQCNDVDIMHIDELLIDVEDREAKLEQIVVQMQRWMEEKEAGDYTDLPCG
jgi:hypothetical protein